MGTYDAGSPSPGAVRRGKGAAPERARWAAIGILALCVVYLLYSGSQSRKHLRAEIDRVAEQVRILENDGKLAEASLSGQIAGLREALENARGAEAGE